MSVRVARRRAAVRRDTAAALLDAAVEVLVADPSASLAEVAEAAGIGRTTLHKHYPTRDHLLRAVGHRSIDRWEQMVAGARGRSAQASITVYPGAYHDFDHPDLPLQQRNGVLVNGSAGRVHVGTDRAAREDALKRVAEWLAR